MGAYKEEKNNNWKAKFSYKDYTGRTRWVTKRGFKTKREALEYEREFLLEKAGDVDMTFASFTELYKKTLYPRLKEDTIEMKDNIINKHVLPYFGKKKLRDITKKDVLSWQDDLIRKINPRTGEHYKSSYLKSVHSQLSAILNFAVRYYDLSDNVAAKVGNMGSEDDANVDFWTEEEYMKFSEAMMEKPLFYYCFEVLYWTGMRKGELFALTLEDIDFAKKTIRINKTFYHINGKDVVTGPKTKKSNRTIVIPDFLVEELKEYVDMIYDCKKADRLFPVSSNGLASALLWGIKKSGVKRIRVHDLRHSHVSFLISRGGFGAVEIASRLGHESKEITYRYAHLFPDAQEKMANFLDDFKNKEK